jgi:hypothetical protein
MTKVHTAKAIPRVGGAVQWKLRLVFASHASVVSIEVVDNSFSLDYSYSLFWEDERILIGSEDLGKMKVLTLSDAEENKQLIWRPDVAFINVLASKINSVVTYITAKAQVLWIRHLYSTFAADYDFSYFPFGENTCIASTPTSLTQGSTQPLAHRPTKS